MPHSPKRSDVHEAAEEFIEAISRHADVIWEPEDREKLTRSLTSRALLILRNEDASF